MTYDDLVADKTNPASLRAWVDYDLTPSEVIVHEAQQWMMHEAGLRLREMVALETGTIPRGAGGIPIPEGFIAPLYLGVTSPGRVAIHFYTGQTVLECAAVDTGGRRLASLPRRAAVMGDAIRFEAVADQDYDYELLCYRELPRLGPDRQENALTKRAPRALRFACMALAYDHLENRPEYDRYLARAMQSVTALNAQADEALYRGLDEVPRVV